MSIRRRLFLALLLLIGAGFYLLIDWILADLRPRYLATMEESMVDTAALLSSWLGNEAREGKLETAHLRNVFDNARGRRLTARIYEVTKSQLGMRVYVTDDKGIVIFDSEGGRDEGRDYSRWNDVYQTLRGNYGARTTLRDPGDPYSDVLHVASPIESEGRILGVLTVCKPADSVTVFLMTTRIKVMAAGAFAAVSVVVLVLLVSSWITWPIEKLTRYAHALRDGERAALPELGRNEIGELGKAFEEMHRALEGKQYVEDYVQTLTHQMKSPLSAIRGAAELLEEDLAPEERARFLQNLRSESERIRDLVDRMLLLSSIENQRGLRDVEDVDFCTLLREIAASMQARLEARRIRVDIDALSPLHVLGERFLLRQALANLLDNAVDFSPDGGVITVTFGVAEGNAAIRIVDEGPGIPDYAHDRLFERFYSLQRRHGGKSTGLGLSLVAEVAELHGGRASVANRPEGGAEAVLVLPTET